MSDLVFQPLHRLAQMIRDRQVSAVEVLEAHLTQIAKHNATLNAICTLDEENACRRAQQADAAIAQMELLAIAQQLDTIIGGFQRPPGYSGQHSDSRSNPQGGAE